MAPLLRRRSTAHCSIHGDNGCENQGEFALVERAREKRQVRREVEQELAEFLGSDEEVRKRLDGYLNHLERRYQGAKALCEELHPWLAEMAADPSYACDECKDLADRVIHASEYRWDLEEAAHLLSQYEAVRWLPQRKLGRRKKAS